MAKPFLGSIDFHLRSLDNPCVMKNTLLTLLVAGASVLAAFVAFSKEKEKTKKESETKIEKKAVSETESTKTEGDTAGVDKQDPLEVISLGAGCFWCIEAVIERIEGVVSAESGYMGGNVKNPTYEQICEKTTGHAEIVKVTFDPKKISLERVFDAFWELHDPTTLNQQGNDKGPQYRSAIYYYSAEQKKAAEESMKKAASKFDDPIVTEITKASDFWPAEDYHQDFFTNNQNYPYCRALIVPKLKKMGLLKD
jgi:peptide-methionine (S)-S-oxide reductase